MLQATRTKSASSAGVYFLPQAHLAKAKALLIELQLQNRQELGLARLMAYHQELDSAIKHFPTYVHGQHILPELKSRRLAFACSIERRQAFAA